MLRGIVIILGLAGLAWALLSLPQPARLSGRAIIVDGDTLRLGETRIRVFGIDAPEAATPLGPRATDWLRRRLEGREVICVEKDTDRYGRTVATCFAGGRDIAQEMVAEGWARAYRRFSLDYADEEADARAAGLGIWAEPLAAASAARACAIKGNISGSGRRLYHLRGTRAYDMTKIDESRGERWFCSEAEARAAGWSAAGR